ncbi:MAG: hypothetical protein IIA09_18955 [Proteobacteria bacterium]|nr:hypothetical protein [Pseudomonadota bacterium]
MNAVMCGMVEMQTGTAPVRESGEFGMSVAEAVEFPDVTALALRVGHACQIEIPTAVLVMTPGTR